MSPRLVFMVSIPPHPLFNIPQPYASFNFHGIRPLLLKSSSAMPAHHTCDQEPCTRLVVGLAWAASRFLALPPPTGGYSTVRSQSRPATLYALSGSPTSCQVLLQSFKVQHAGLRESAMHGDTVVVRGRGDHSRSRCCTLASPEIPAMVLPVSVRRYGSCLWVRNTESPTF